MEIKEPNPAHSRVDGTTGARGDRKQNGLLMQELGIQTRRNAFLSHHSEDSQSFILSFLFSKYFEDIYILSGAVRELVFPLQHPDPALRPHLFVIKLCPRRKNSVGALLSADECLPNPE
jgi:hypothetical protein